MKKQIVICLFLLIVSVSSSSAAEFTEGYQKVKWGMSPEQVKVAYPATRSVGITETPVLSLASVIDETEVEIVFRFSIDSVERLLNEVNIIFNMEPSTEDAKLYQIFYESEYMNEFDKLEILLESKYGAPKSKVRRGNTLNSTGRAIANGDADFITEWESQESTIKLSLTATYKDKVLLAIHYGCKRLQLIDEKPDESIATNQL